MPISIEIWQATQEDSRQTMPTNLENDTAANKFEVSSHSIPKIKGDLKDYCCCC